MKDRDYLIYAAGLVPVIWLALLAAPFIDGGLVSIMQNLPDAVTKPLDIDFCKNSIKTVIIFAFAYAMGIGIYLSTRRNYRRGQEHGSAKWGDALKLGKKYRSKTSGNKILTQNVQIGMDGYEHRRNLNVIVCGGSGSGKTRGFVQPNLMQAETSFICLDPKGENTRAVGNLLLEKNYVVKVLDLIQMSRSHCYNPFVYLKDDNDVQRLVTNLFKSTTPKGAQSSDPFGIPPLRCFCLH